MQKDNEAHLKEPLFAVINSETINGITTIKYRFGDTVDTYSTFDAAKTIKPYAGSKNVYLLKVSTDESQDG